MKKFKTFFATAMLMCAMTFTAMADETIGTVSMGILLDEDETISPGEVISGMEPVIDDTRYYIDELEVSDEESEPKRSYYYTLTVVPEDGYMFSNDTGVKVKGATSVSIKERNKYYMKLKIKTYPYHVLPEPKNIVINKDTNKVTWDKVENAKSYSVLVYYTNNNGSEKVSKKTAKTNSLDLKSYLTRYEDVYVSVKALKGNTDTDKFLCDSDYIYSDGGIDEDHSEEEYKFSVPTATVGNTSENTGSTGTPPEAPESTIKDGWYGSGNDWTYIYNGKKVSGWLGLDGSWFLLDANGKMLSGWQYVNNNWYLLNTNHDGSYGKMLTGWQQVNGKWYFLNPYDNGNYGAMVSNRWEGNYYLGNDGAMLVNTKTPDGYKVGADGAWLK